MSARLIVLGRQGAGKGTQCARLAAALGVPHVSTGDLFRREIALSTTLGRRIERYVGTGRLVPDDLVLDAVAATLGDADSRARGYLLDGFPRTLAQGQALFEVLGANAADIAVELLVPVDVVMRRLAERGRDDDHPELIARRLALYEEEAAPLLVWLDSMGMLVTVDGVGEPDEVHERLVDAVAARIPALRARIS